MKRAFSFKTLATCMIVAVSITISYNCLRNDSSASELLSANINALADPATKPLFTCIGEQDICVIVLDGDDLPGKLTLIGSIIVDE